MSDDVDLDAGLGAGLRALTTLLLSEETLETTLRQVAEIATRCVAGGAGATITLVDRGRPFTAYSTDERSRTVDGVQFEQHAGPCITAIQEQRVVAITTASSRSTHEHNPSDGSWSNVLAQAAACGIVSMLAVPLIVRNQPVGTLNIYSDIPAAFGDEQVEDARMLASQAAVSVANARTHDQCVSRISQLQEALDTRVVIEQAKGVLMERNQISSDRAFELLRQTSQNDNRKLRDVAGDLVGSFDS